MSEHQIVVFRAIDAPVSAENLQYMRRQSTRAKITPWSFVNEYHFGDFHGNAEEMLRRGFDVHLHYADFGIRKLMIRLPHGLQAGDSVDAYFEEESLEFVADESVPGGVLVVEPFNESGDLDPIWNFDDFVERIIPLRAEILEGDLRPLYLAHLAIACDSNHDQNETMEAPVPAGLDELTDAQRALAEWYCLSDSLLAAAAQNCPALAGRMRSGGDPKEWLKGQPEFKKNAWLADVMEHSHSTVRREILAEFQAARRPSFWPTVHHARTVAELQAEADAIRDQADEKAEENASRQRAERLVKIAADPKLTIRETERLVLERSTAAYERIATLLAELREALFGASRSDLADQQARKLKSKHPTLRKLNAELRKHGFLLK